MWSPRRTPRPRSQFATWSDLAASRRVADGLVGPVVLDDAQREPVGMLGGDHVEPVERPVELVKRGPRKAGDGRRVLGRGGQAAGHAPRGARLGRKQEERRRCALLNTGSFTRPRKPRPCVLRTSADTSPTALTAVRARLINVNNWEEPAAGPRRTSDHGAGRQVARAVAEREQGRRRLKATTVTVSFASVAVAAWSPRSSLAPATRPSPVREATRRPVQARPAAPRRARAQAGPPGPPGRRAAHRTGRAATHRAAVSRHRRAGSSRAVAAVSAPPPAVPDPV